jgi:hypothetical protein
MGEGALLPGRGGTWGPMLVTLLGFLLAMLFVFVATVELLPPGMGIFIASVGLTLFLLGSMWGMWRARPVRERLPGA